MHMITYKSPIHLVVNNEIVLNMYTRVVRKVCGLSQYNLTDMSEIIETRI